MITLRPVDPKTDTKFLYDLLAERPPEANISHSEMPTWEQHVTFVKTHGFCYEAWYIIGCPVTRVDLSTKESTTKQVPVGSIYITRRDEVCVHIKPNCYGQGFEKLAIEELMRLHPRRRYLFNVAPNNQQAHRFYQDEMGLKVIQWTYVKDMP